MKKILLIFILSLLPSIAFAQCNGVFQPHTACGNNTAGQAVPSQVPIASLAVPSGTNGQIQYNNSGFFGGFTAGQDCTITTSSGIVNCTKLQNVAVTTTGASTGDALYFNGAGFIHGAIGTIITASCTVSPTACVTAFGYGYAPWWGVKCDGSTDDAAALQAAITALAGNKLYVQAGTCVVKTSLTYTTSSASVFTQGLQIFGAGREKTIFDNQIANGFLIATDTTANFFFQSGVTLSDFKITTTTFPATSSGISLHRSTYILINDIQITSLTGTGISIQASIGDADAAFVVRLERVRMDSIAGWCADFSAPSGGYFGTNLRVEDSTFQGCGTSSASVPPTSGAVKFKGLIAQFVNLGFTINQNVDLYIAGPDSSENVIIEGVDFENLTSSVLPHVYIDGGLLGFNMINSQCLNNDSFIAQGCVWLNSTSTVITNVNIDKTLVRATTANNTYTAFKTTGANAFTDAIRVTNTFWQTFDLTGQIRFSGIKFSQINGVGQFIIVSTNTGVLRANGFGQAMPLHLAATGEWVEFALGSSGVGIATGTKAATTQYFFYLFNIGGAGPYTGSIEAVTTAQVVDANSGYTVKTGDSTRTYIGTWTTDGSGNFQPGGTGSSWYPAH